MLYATVYYSCQSMLEAGWEASPVVPSSVETCRLVLRVLDSSSSPSRVGDCGRLRLARVMNAVSPRERPMGTMDATLFAVSLSMSYNWLSTLVRTNVHTHAWL